MSHRKTRNYRVSLTNEKIQIFPKPTKLIKYERVSKETSIFSNLPITKFLAKNVALLTN